MKSEAVIKRYSQAFRQEVVKEYEAGSSISDLRKKYGIAGGNTVQAWIRQYGREGLRRKLMVIQQPEEQNLVKVYKDHINQLEKVVARLSLDKLILEASLAEAEARSGEDVKKNGEAKSLSGSVGTAGHKAGR